MAYLKYGTAQNFGKRVTERMKSMTKDALTNKGKEFMGGLEQLRRERFVQYIGSASHAFMLRRRNRYHGEYYGA